MWQMENLLRMILDPKTKGRMENLLRMILDPNTKGRTITSPHAATNPSRCQENRKSAAEICT